MDSDLETAAQHLARFDALAALRLVGTREDPEALALRGVAMAQLGEDRDAQRLLGRAERAFARTDPSMHARVVAARGEVALASRDLALAGRLLEAAERALGGDRVNRTFVRFLRVRRLLLLGRVEEARVLATIDVRGAPPRLRVLAELLRADIAARRLRALEAEAAIARARTAARSAALPPLTAQVERLAGELAAPVARVIHDRTFALATLSDVASLARSKGLVVDGCRRELRRDGVTVSLATRPVLFSIAEALGEAAPGTASRALLIERGFGARRTTESLRARLRVEIGRLRRVLAPIAMSIEATGDGFRLDGGREAMRVTVVLPPADGEASLLLALLRDGEIWSSSSLASASGLGQRAVQRALADLKDAGKVDAHGTGRSRRWVASAPEGFATTLLLPRRPAPR
jgi:DNA-binding transcriptional ArsR family regulator